jgi:adenylate kinase family enzyme
MRIEMAGPPTSGKSSLVKALKAMGIKRGPAGKIDRIPKQWKSFEDFVRRVYEGSSFQKLPDKTLASIAAGWKGSRHKKWMVFDELLILCGFSLAIRMPQYAKEYFETVPLPELLIVLSAKEDVLMKRNLARGEKNRPDKTMRCIEAHNKYLPILRRRKCRILRFDTSKLSTADIVKLVLIKLAKIDGETDGELRSNKRTK